MSKYPRTEGEATDSVGAALVLALTLAGLAIGAALLVHWALIPPAYTEWIGKQLLASLDLAA